MAKANELIVSYNALLRSKLMSLLGLDINMLDTHTCFEDAIAHPEKLVLHTGNPHAFQVHMAMRDWTTGQIETMWPSEKYSQMSPLVQYK
ncbi:hypothetical protein Unana1_01715 [Umbelopsis nana]